MYESSALAVLSSIGWGTTSFNSSFSEFLQEAKMPVVDYETCAAGNINLPQKVDDLTMVCAGYGGKSVISGCHGDSGGPFVCKESGRWVLRGTVSWGDHRCRGRSTFSVFARISTFVDWIQAALGNPNCDAGKILINLPATKYPLQWQNLSEHHCHLEKNGNTDNDYLANLIFVTSSDYHNCSKSITS